VTKIDAVESPDTEAEVILGVDTQPEGTWQIWRVRLVRGGYVHPSIEVRGRGGA
jgi:hypothetical protein